MASANNASPEPEAPVAPSSGGVRRHHTITATSRASRPVAITEEQHEPQQQPQQMWNEDEPVNQDWVGGVGAVGEKGGLHRQASLPTRYHRSFQAQGNSGSLTPKKTLNSLSAIAGHEGDEEDWERDISQYRDEDQVSTTEHAQHQQLLEQATQSPLNSHFSGTPINAPSPPPASGVRRHQSLTYGPGSHGVRHSGSTSGLRRSGTLQAQVKHSNVPQPGPRSPSPTNAEEDYPDEGKYEDEYYATNSPHSQAMNPTSPIGRSSPWGSQGNEWRGTSGSGYTGGNASIDDVQRALSSLEINSGPYQNNAYGQQGPRDNGYNNAGRKLPVATDYSGRQTPSSQGPASASGYNQSQHQRAHTHTQGMQERDERVQTVSGGGWEQKDRVLGGRSSNPNLGYLYQRAGEGNVPNVPPIPAQYLQQQGHAQAPRLGISTSGIPNQGGSAQNLIGTPIDVPTLIATKGYNPTNFDIRPQFARFFVIKSYTEDDVHKSLKYEIWSSTDPGNKRLDKAFKETAGRGPIYLFFSVNASGHFCGMAEMLTPVDYTRSSTVWASDKWKGVFKVRWIFVRDIPNANLRHIRLNNTQERKPVTNSRDTQELLPDAGQEMLRIFHSHPARTSLLQDFAFYELQSMQKIQQQGPSTSPPLNSPAQPQGQQLSPINSPQQTPYNMGMSSPNIPYGMAQLTPMMQMQMQMQMNMGGMGTFGMPQSQAMHQSVLRNPSPGPPNQNGQNYMGMPNF